MQEDRAGLSGELSTAGIIDVEREYLRAARPGRSRDRGTNTGTRAGHDPER
jgi:hypothetical protein